MLPNLDFYTLPFINGLFPVSYNWWHFLLGIRTYETSSLAPSTGRIAAIYCIIGLLVLLLSSHCCTILGLKAAHTCSDALWHYSCCGLHLYEARFLVRSTLQQSQRLLHSQNVKEHLLTPRVSTGPHNGNARHTIIYGEITPTCWPRNTSYGGLE